MTNRIEAAVFDVDGMLLDTREFIFQAFEYMLPLHGYPLPDREELTRQMGPTLRQNYEALAPGGDIETLVTEHRQWQSDKFYLIEPFPGLSNMLLSLKNAGLAIGAFSNRKGHLIPSLEHAGVLDFFDAIVSAGDIQRPKPHPDGLLAVLAKLAVDPQKAAMLGDTDIDIQTGKAAGVAFTVGITHGFGTRMELEQAKADYIVDSLAEIPALLIS